jgi:uncharacterized protein YkwD
MLLTTTSTSGAGSFPATCPGIAGRTLLLATLVAGALIVTAPFATAQEKTGLLQLINLLRVAPDTCHGKPVRPVPALVFEPAFSRVSMAPGTYLPFALEKLGYPAEQAEGIYVSGPADAQGVLSVIRSTHCTTLLNGLYTAGGIVRSGNDWLIVLAAPQRLPQLPDWTDTGKAILQLVNEARAAPRRCGEQQFPAAPPLAWNAALGQAALAHSRDMAEKRYFSHQGKDGSGAGERAQRAGYQWRRVGENIASGQSTPGEAVSGWLSSPGHCANLMNGNYTEMGAAHAVVNGGRTVYWTQVFGTPR